MRRRCTPGAPARRSGFTLIEILIVAGIIGLLAVLGVPSFMRSRETTRTTRFINDLRIAVAAFEQYALDHGGYPPDGLPAVAVPTMKDYLTRVRWTDPTPIGGSWDWDFGQFGFRAGVSVYRPTVPPSRMVEIDGRIDDGDLAAGRFRRRTDGYIYIIEFNTPSASQP